MSSVTKVLALHNHVRPSVGRQRRMINASSPVQGAFATSWPALRPSQTARNHAAGAEVSRQSAIPKDANKNAAEVCVI